VIGIECNTLVEQLMSQLEPRIMPEPGQSECVLRTPFLYPDNTPIIVFVQVEEEKVIVSDHGEASDYVFLNGADPGVVESRLKLAVQRYRLTPLDDELIVEADLASLASAVLSVVGAAQDFGYLV
jgi:hypothetical protein